MVRELQACNRLLCKSSPYTLLSCFWNSTPSQFDQEQGQYRTLATKAEQNTYQEGNNPQGRIKKISKEGPAYGKWAWLSALSYIQKLTENSGTRSLSLQSTVELKTKQYLTLSHQP